MAKGWYLMEEEGEDGVMERGEESLVVRSALQRATSTWLFPRHDEVASARHCTRRDSNHHPVPSHSTLMYLLC